MDTQMESDGDNLDLAQLMAQIRKDAESRESNTLYNGAPTLYRQLITQDLDAVLSSRDLSLPPLNLQPALEKRERYHVNDLLAFHDDAFVRAAYKAILKREPDDTGHAQFLKNLRNG